jgi:adenylosuccinate synthase
MINKLDALSWAGDWKGELKLCVAYEDRDGRRCDHVPRNEAVRKTLRPVFESFPGWTEDISRVRRFADLPATARRYVAAMMRAVVDVAYAGEPRPASLPNLRYLGVGPGPSQIIKDIPGTAELIRGA